MRTLRILVAVACGTLLVDGMAAENAKNVTKGAPAKGPSDMTFSKTLKNRVSALGRPDGEQKVMENEAGKKVSAIQAAAEQQKADRRYADMIQTRILNDTNVVRAVDADGRTLLHQAAFAGYPQCVKLLLKRGSNRAAKDHSGATPAALARIAGYPEIATQIDTFKP